jgi:hypothetical protein
MKNQNRLSEVRARHMGTAIYRTQIKNAVESWKGLYPLVKRAPAEVRKALHGLAEPLTMEEDNRFRDRRGQKDTDNSTPHDSLKY